MASPIFHPTEKAWYPLDNSALILASSTSSITPFIFRMSCTLDAPIRLTALEEALKTVSSRFPLFMVELRAGFFWYYLEPIHAVPKVVADSRYPAEFLNIRKKGRHLFRVRAFRNRIACEFHHMITDGTGALAFLRALVVEYCVRTGSTIRDYADVHQPGESPHPEESEDAYTRLYGKSSAPPPSRPKPAFHLPRPYLPFHAYRVTTIVLPLAATLAVAKSHGLTLTEYLASVHLAALQDVYESLPKFARRKAGHLPTVLVPVSLRKLHPSKTLRNFTLTVSASIDARLGHFGFDEIAERVRHALRTETNEKYVRQQIARNVGGERNPFLRAIPLGIKNVVMRLLYLSLGDRPMSGSLSNVGAVRLPEGAAERASRFDFVPARSWGTGANVGVVSYADALCVNIGSVVRDNALERKFCSRLVEAGLSVKLECNT